MRMDDGVDDEDDDEGDIHYEGRGEHVDTVGAVALQVYRVGNVDRICGSTLAWRRVRSN